jgi:hypothetical protein
LARSVKGVSSFNLVTKLKRAEEEGWLVLALVLSMTFVALLPAFSSALAALEGAPAPVRLRVLLEGFPEHLTVHISVYNLTERGAVRVARASALGPPPPEGLTFDFAVRKTFGWVDARILYEIFRFNVFAYTYDPERGKLYVASAYVTVSPEQYEYAVELKAKRVHSRRVSGDQVPVPGQSAQFLDRHATSVAIAACSVPPGASCYYSIQGAKILIETFEKMYWTDDPTLQTWVEEDWGAAGYTSYRISCIKTERFSDASMYDFPANVDYVMATVGEGPSPLYIVRVLLYVKDINRNACFASGYWTPCSEGKYLTQFVRPETGTKSWERWEKYVGFEVQRENFSASFSAMGDRDKKVQVEGSFNLTFKIELHYIMFQVSMDDWSKAPSNANYLRIYSCDNAWLMVRAQYEP